MIEAVQQAYQQQGVNGVLVALLCVLLGALAVMYRRQIKLEDAARELQGNVIRAMTEATHGSSKVADAMDDLSREVREAMRRVG